MGTLFSLSHPLCVLLFCSALLCGCTQSSTDPHDTIVGSGTIVSEDRAVGSFTGIQVTGTAKVFLTQDSVESLRVEADDNILPRVETSVRGGNLIVGLEEGSYNNITVNVYASMKEVGMLECTGAADFVTVTPVHSNAIVCRITGAGHITLAGSTTAQSIVISGAGAVHNFELTTSRTSVLISGTGSVEVHAADELTATISGTGSVVYSGNPPLVHQTVSGVGTISPR